MPLEDPSRGKRERWKKCSQQHLLIDIVRTVLGWVLWDGVRLERSMVKSDLEFFLKDYL